MPGALQFRQFRIQKKGSSFVLEGWEREFRTVRALLDALQGCTLRSGDDSFTVKRCCLPKPGGSARFPFPSAVKGGAALLARPAGHQLLLLAEISDLLITTQKVKDNAKRILNLTQLSFHQIRKDEITQVGGLSPTSVWCGGKEGDLERSRSHGGRRGPLGIPQSHLHQKNNCWPADGQPLATGTPVAILANKGTSSARGQRLATGWSLGCQWPLWPMRECRWLVVNQWSVIGHRDASGHLGQGGHTTGL